MDRAETGRRGEQAAARYYIGQGCTLLARNYRIREGEIDLILRDPAGVIVFCEVKTRTDRDALCRPAASVTMAKRRRIIRTARQYLQQTDYPRIDVTVVKEDYEPAYSCRYTCGGVLMQLIDWSSSTRVVDLEYSEILDAYRVDLWGHGN